jgi:hypothetical protein
MNISLHLTLLLNLISVQETITHYNIKLYPPRQTIINTVFSPHAVVLWNSLPYTVVNAKQLRRWLSIAETLLVL